MAARFDLDIEQGADLVRTFAWSNEDGTRRTFDGYTPHAHIRARHGAPITLDLSMYLDVLDDVELDDGSTGQALQLAVPGAVTGTLRHGGVWDLFLRNTGTPTSREALVYGAVKLRKAVTTVA